MSTFHETFQAIDRVARQVYGYQLDTTDGGEAWAHRVAYAGYCRRIAQGLKKANSPEWLVNRWIESSKNALKSAREWRELDEILSKAKSPN